MSTRRPYFMMSKGFLTKEELRTGDPKAIQGVDRSLSKLHQHTQANWSYLDITPTQFVSPANFERVYKRDPVEAISKNVSLTKVLKDILSSKKGAPLTLEPKEMRNQ